MRIATFNVENLDNQPDNKNPSIEVRAPILRSELERLDASIICLQEVHGQETPNHTSNNPDRILSALSFVIKGTKYEEYHQAITLTSDGVPYDQRNLVVLSKYPIKSINQYRNTHIDALQYKKVTAIPKEEKAKKITWERPILHAEIEIRDNKTIHIINLHLKSRLSSNISGQKIEYSWKSAAGWAEGYFLSSIKRVGQALETRVLVDKLFDQDPKANIVVCGDFNAEPGEVPVEAIRGSIEDTNNPELQSRSLIPCSRAIPYSVRFSHLHHGEKNLLDHMLISQSLLASFKNAEIYNENLHDESLPFTFDTKYPESDHAAFVGEFSI
jgi:endonuclease/exonuclease/phosphatase family metal-dependent hydrolase